jgi:hypothetical protein
LKFEKGEETDLKKFEDILVQCIEDIKAGRSSIEDCLDRYPSLREQLEPLLRIALEIRETPDVKPSPSFKVKARVWLMDQIHGRQTVTKWPWFRYSSQTKPIQLRRRFSMVGVILAIVLTLSAIGGGTAYAAQYSLPGDALYPVKLGTEELRMMLPGNDVAKAQRALSFAERRVGEMEALAEKGHPQYMGLAVEGYDDAMNMTSARIERASDRGLATGNITARVTEATTRHLSVLDTVYDMVPPEAKEAIAHARNVSETGYFHALAALTRNNTVRASEMNLAAMLGRLNRVRARVGDVEAMGIALQQFEAMAEFSEEISQIAQEIGLNITEVEELVAIATSMHLAVLADVWERVPEQAKPSIERAMANLQIRHQKRVQALEQMGVEAPLPPVIPETVRERVKERIREREEGIQSGTTSPTVGAPGGAYHQYGLDAWDSRGHRSLG